MSENNLASIGLSLQRELIQDKVNELKILADQKLSSKNKMGK